MSLPNKKNVEPNQKPAAGRVVDSAKKTSPAKKAVPSQPRDVTNSTSQSASGLEFLLSLEARMRAVSRVEELQILAANDTRKLTGARQVFLLKRQGVGNAFRVCAVSSMSTFDRETPLLRWVEKVVAKLEAANGIDATCVFPTSDFSEESSEDSKSYPFHDMLWQPIKSDGADTFAGLLQARERAWTDDEKVVSQRIAGTLGHAWAALTGKRRLVRKAPWKRYAIPLAAASMMALGFVPVPLSTLAPIEVSPRDAFIIAAPIDGVIDAIALEPNTVVEKGDLLFQFDPTNAKNRFTLAEQEVRVAQANYRKMRQGAFSEDESRFNLSISREEYALKKAESDYARELLNKTRVVAPTSGLLIYGDKNELKGRPVSTGEAIMKIADPNKVSIEISLPVADAIVLQEGANVRVFLDADPLKPLEARIRNGSYHAEPTPSGTLAYNIDAELVATDTPPPRIGSRGTAQVYGETVSLAFYLFRRPISYLRQHFGI